jgi:methylmalonyl-CoA/ethylmalonyl-CoA epimerase
VRLEVPGRSNIRWEVLSPTREDSPLQAYIDSPRGPGLHHVGVEVASLQEVRTTVLEQGIDAGTAPGDRIDAWMNKRGVEGLIYRFGENGNASCGGQNGAAADANAPNTLGAKCIDHICQAFWDRDELARWYENLAGYKEQWRTPDGEHDDLADLVMDVPGGQLSWEIIMPVGEESFIERFVETRGSSAHHVTFEVRDWEAAMKACEHHGIPTFDPNEGETDGGHWNDTFIHPKHTGGMLVQLFWEEKPGVWVRSDKVRPG